MGDKQTGGSVTGASAPALLGTEFLHHSQKTSLIISIRVGFRSEKISRSQSELIMAGGGMLICVTIKARTSRGTNRRLAACHHPARFNSEKATILNAIKWLRALLAITFARFNCIITAAAAGSDTKRCFPLRLYRFQGPLN